MLDFETDKENVWEFLHNCKCPVYIYGMGNGADKVLNVFDQKGIKCCGVIASDDFVRGQSFRGFTVEKLSSAEEKNAQLVVAVTFGTQRTDVMRHIKDIAQKHKTVVPSVPVFGDVIADKKFLEQNAYTINRAYRLLADERSRKAFACGINFNYSGNPAYLWQSESEKSEAFSNILKLSENERYLDLGAYRGDTIQEFLTYCGGKYKSITAVEPDKKNYKKLCEYAQGFKSTTLLQNGIYSKCTKLMFGGGNGRGSTLRQYKAADDLQVVTVDSLCDNSQGFSYIKADVEGAEKDALLGACETLKKFKPKLNIAAYHTLGDIFNLIIQINMINPDYKIYLRHHPYIPAWDTNLYCV